MIVPTQSHSSAVNEMAGWRWAFTFCSILLIPTYIGGGFARPCFAAEPSAFLLRTNTTVNAEGIFLSQVLAAEVAPELPVLRLADAPAFGQAVTLTVTEIQALLRKSSLESPAIRWTGADRVRVTRRARTLDEAEIKQLLTVALQKEVTRDKGEVELRFARPWPTATIADDSFVLNFLDLPTSGPTPSMTLRFELRHGRELLGTWQVAAHVYIWREVWVAQTVLKRGELLSESNLTRQRRDVLVLRDALGALPASVSLELAENIQEGAPLLTRSVRPRPVIRRGDLIEASLQDGLLEVSLRVEVLEDGVAGQIIRVRNPQSKREFRGKVQNEQSILIAL
ncbi:MAG: flagellar basal body P-ring formation protein FlgA [Verrucomicrobia bacterium]|nr:flagellar basal body P-ring formation protein FlgA [Verrucomicrobiota bacterium]